MSKKTRVNVWLDAAELESCKKECDRLGISLSEAVRVLMKYFVEGRLKITPSETKVYFVDVEAARSMAAMGR